MENISLTKTRKRFKHNFLNMRIATLKKQLAIGDYRVIKCIESYLVDKEAPLPYMIEEIAAERNMIRNKINNLQLEVEILVNELKNE